ncbi:unnamed protein product [Clonostachys rosea]|uniref:Heterokaryon incompatibility domain-containing protein n=1 Tax=Bionectria ochroleuca TaxID=29856 RepID=A0ABY6UU57_BIOOC|nr:unnamed protein product [Clonostachys rosea]
MRLLHTSSLDLVEIPDDAVPSYAILSHTWGDQEITLQEMERVITNDSDNRSAVHRITQKEGYLKVKAAAAMALSRNLEYLWVDTCCIDKSSSAELSEAINSMYLWYQQSEECYALLSDVGPEVVEDWTDPQSSLYGSRWFTRGWTLQELVAPSVVLFYASDWTFIGRKDKPESFTRVISEVTGVGCEVLDGRIDPLQLSVSARMAWASRRQTTRREDVAYCLMGLFQVNMPLLYGEGTRAFRRLQEAILQQTDDQSLFAWNSADDLEDEDEDALSSLLAKSPAQFAYAGDIQPLPPLPTYASMPSSMTNQGLHVHLYLRPAEDDYGDSYEAPMEEDFDAILDCVIRVDNTYLCPVIRLRRLSEDQYGRIQTRSRRLLPPPSPYNYCSDDEGYQHVYVRQEPMYYHLPQFRIPPSPSPTPPDSEFGISSTMSSSDHSLFRFSNAFPPRQWNSHTMTLKVNYSRKIQAMGLFRYQSSTWENSAIDVVVGLRRLNAMQWEGWCFQMRSTCSIEESFDSINSKISKAIEGTKNADISPRLLRDTIGDDARLITEATVSGTQLQGRLYVSITLATKPEIHAAGVTLTPEQQEKLRDSLIEPSDEDMEIANEFEGQDIDMLQRDVQLLTGPCSQTTWEEFVDHDPETIASFNPRAVRILNKQPPEPTEPSKDNTDVKTHDESSNSPRNSLNIPRTANHERQPSSARSSWNLLRPLSHILTMSATLSSPFEPTRIEKLRSTSSPMTSKSTKQAASIGFFLGYLRDFIAELKQGPVANFTASPVQLLAISLFDGEKEKAEKIISRYPELLDPRVPEAATSDKYGLLPVHWATAGGFTESLDLLLKKRGREILQVVSRGGLGALHIASMCASPSWIVIRDALDMDSFTALASLPTKHLQETPLHLMAAYYSRRPTASDSDDFYTWLQLVGELVSNVSTDCRNLYEETPLHRAAACNNEAMIDFLLSQARNRHLVDALDRFGRTPIWHAAATGSAEAVKALIKTGASINLADDLGMTPLHAASREGHCDVILLLLQSRAYITNETLGLNFTALDYAAMFGHTACVRALVTTNLELSFPEPTRWMEDIGSAIEPDHRLQWAKIKTRALQIASSCGWLGCASTLCRYHADPFIPLGSYLKLNDAGNCAFVVLEKGSALTTAMREGHEDIVKFLEEQASAVKGSDEHDEEHLVSPHVPTEVDDWEAAPAEDADYAEMAPGKIGSSPAYSPISVEDVIRPPTQDSVKGHPDRIQQQPHGDRTSQRYRESVVYPVDSWRGPTDHGTSGPRHTRQDGYNQGDDPWADRRGHDDEERRQNIERIRQGFKYENHGSRISTRISEDDPEEFMRRDGRPRERFERLPASSRPPQQADHRFSRIPEYNYASEPTKDSSSNVAQQPGQSTVLTMQTGSGPGYSRFGSQRSAQQYQYSASQHRRGPSANQQYNVPQHRSYEPALLQRSGSSKVSQWARGSSRGSDRSQGSVKVRHTTSTSNRQRPSEYRASDHSPPTRPMAQPAYSSRQRTMYDDEDPGSNIERLYSTRGSHDMIPGPKLSLPARPKPRLRLSPPTTYSRTILSAPPDVRQIDENIVLQPRILGPLASPSGLSFQYSPNPLVPRDETQEQWEAAQYSPATPEPDGLERRLLSMLGAIGHPSMIENVISEDDTEMQYDETYGIVRRAPGSEDDGAERDSEGLPVYELSAIEYDDGYTEI